MYYAIVGGKCARCAWLNNKDTNCHCTVQLPARFPATCCRTYPQTPRQQQLPQLPQFPLWAPPSPGRPDASMWATCPSESRKRRSWSSSINKCTSQDSLRRLATLCWHARSVPLCTLILTLNTNKVPLT